MKRKLVITYEFNTKDIEPVSKKEAQTLEEYAIEKIFEYMHDGFTSCELICDISEDIEIYGWFEVQKTNEN